jgi:hypothetical protein
MGCLPSSVFLSVMGHFDWPITPKKQETWEARQNSTFFVRTSTFPLAHLYRWEGKNFGQSVWEEGVVLLERPLGNTFETWGKLLKTFGNTQGTWWEHETEEFYPDIPISPKGKRWAIVSSPVSLAACANSIPKTGCHHFWLSYYPFLRVWVPLSKKVFGQQGPY